MTPEGKVKAAVNKVLAKYKKLYRFMPVPGGYGESSLDYLLCVNGLFCAIETKAPGQKPTARQKFIAEKIIAAGGTVFIIDDVSATHELEAFLKRATHASTDLSKT
jgi:hypothetical protein